MLPQHVTADLTGHHGPARAVRFNYSGSYCLTCGTDKTVKLWNPHRGTIIKTYTGHGREVLDAAAARDNARIATCGADKLIRLFDVSTGNVIRTFRGHMERINCLKFNEECTLLISGSYDATVRVWDLKSRSFEPIQVIDDARDSVTSLQVTDYEILTGSVDSYVRNYDLRMGKLYQDCVGSAVTSVSFTNDRQCIVASSLDNRVRLFDKIGGDLLNEYSGHKNEDYKIDSCTTNTDAHIVSGSEEGRICFWDLVETKMTHTLSQGSKTSIIYSIAYHPKETCLLAASSDGSIKVWKGTERAKAE
ncbi:WD repeat domain-containing protein 83-like [Oscarella lobularis]|uniref:WD repeat domain-containing protein 83-like n=1 Tax=Oscarella lobularis TaxID=121494 RepID=UPI003313E4C3